jgi:phage gp16-like protein
MSENNDRRRDLALIHMGCKELALGEDEYRAMCFSLTGKRSSADMDAAERGKLLQRMRALGFRGQLRKVRRLRERHHRMALGLWIELARAGIVRDPSDAALNHFVQRLTGVSALGWADAHQTNQVIEGLKAMRDRGMAAIEAAVERNSFRWSDAATVGALKRTAVLDG